MLDGFSCFLLLNKCYGNSTQRSQVHPSSGWRVTPPIAFVKGWVKFGVRSHHSVNHNCPRQPPEPQPPEPGLTETVEGRECVSKSLFNIVRGECLRDERSSQGLRPSSGSGNAADTERPVWSGSKYTFSFFLNAGNNPSWFVPVCWKCLFPDGTNYLPLKIHLKIT